jgi:hypothetical protein
MSDGVHSALKNHNKVPSNPFSHRDRGAVFQWDAYGKAALPESYSSVDVLFAALPWPTGWKVFEERAGAVSGERSYAGFIRSVVEMTQATSLPAFYVTAKPSLKWFPSSWWRFPVGLFGSTVDLVGTEPLPGAEGEMKITDFIAVLAKRFDCVGDFCCGYGQTGRIFAECGKTFVMSDYNDECIRYLRGEE